MTDQQQAELAALLNAALVAAFKDGQRYYLYMRGSDVQKELEDRYLELNPEAGRRLMREVLKVVE